MNKEDVIKLAKHIKRVSCSSEDGKKRLLTNPKEVFKEAGVPFPEHKKVKFIENKKDLYNLVVPCKRLPRAVRVERLSTTPSYREIMFWMITQIQDNTPLKNRLLKEPLKVLQENKVKVADHVKINVYENSDTMMYLVVPRSQKEGEELSDLELQSVTGGSAKQSIGGSDFHQTSTADPSTNASLGLGDMFGGGEGGEGGEGREAGELGGLEDLLPLAM
ncbi:MAG: hypothetical protein S4CHLAM37_07780 [Chlamydiia bacterium]|nr:hypothetical protein [Chlamydiia bacterium]